MNPMFVCQDYRRTITHYFEKRRTIKKQHVVIVFDIRGKDPNRCIHEDSNVEFVRQVRLG